MELIEAGSELSAMHLQALSIVSVAMVSPANPFNVLDSEHDGNEGINP